MAKFNKTTKGINTTPDTTNKDNFPAFSRDSFKQEVATVVLNTMLKGDSFYEKEGDRIARIEKFVTDNPENGEFLAKAMIYTRNEGNLRSVSHLLAVLLAENVKGSSYLKKAFIKSFVRVDDMMEVLSLWNNRNPNKMVPNSLRRSFTECLESKFDIYQFKKYEGLSKKIKLRDVVKIAHPDPKKWLENNM